MSPLCLVSSVAMHEETLDPASPVLSGSVGRLGVLLLVNSTEGQVVRPVSQILGSEPPVSKEVHRARDAVRLGKQQSNMEALS